MSRLPFLLMIGLGACGLYDANEPGVGLDDVQGWRFSSGKRPSRAEYAAVVAACQDGAVPRTQGKALDICLADMGLRRE
jgi:hypothetical protein